MPDPKNTVDAEILTYEHLLDRLREVKDNYCDGRDEWDALTSFRDALIEIRREVSERVEETNEEIEPE